MRNETFLFSVFFLIGVCPQISARSYVDQYNVVWESQSENSSESMPCGGGDIGLNVWVENDELYFYFSRSGTFDENNCLLVLGRMQISLTPNLLSGVDFRQELVLREGYVRVSAGEPRRRVNIDVRVDVFHPVISVDIQTEVPTVATAAYHSWRYQDRALRGTESNSNSYKWAAPADLVTKADRIAFEGNELIFYHRNQGRTMFDVVTEQQGLGDYKSAMYDPLSNLTFGGALRGADMIPAGVSDSLGLYRSTEYRSWSLRSARPGREHQIELVLHTAQAEDLSHWHTGLEANRRNWARDTLARQTTLQWWREYWERSFIVINEGEPESEGWKIGRNYQLFRYMLGCNAYGQWPTKFNGGLFTYDPGFVNPSYDFTPDFRNWGGGTHTAQNQRLVYFPMLKSGDFELMLPQFDFYLRALENAELRSRVYWNHPGASFTEQIENFGLPNPSEYGWKRPEDYDPGMEYNAWLEYQWDTALEFCLMILETERYAGADIEKYVPLIESCLTFFDEHYRYLARLRGVKELNEDGKIVFYPGSACETYKMAYDAVSTIEGLRTVARKFIALEDRWVPAEKKEKWTAFLASLPEMTFRKIDGHRTIAPAKLWERVNNTESPQLYPVFPWRVYGVGREDLQTARDTYLYDPDVVRFRSHVGWKQDNIWAACLGLTQEAKELTLKKLGDSDRRFPTFWGPGFDWTPDHNWGGSGMIGLQEMAMQEVEGQIIVLPAWPEEWDVHFRLHGAGRQTVEVKKQNGRVEIILAHTGIE